MSARTAGTCLCWCYTDATRRNGFWHTLPVGPSVGSRPDSEGLRMTDAPSLASGVPPFRPRRGPRDEGRSTFASRPGPSPNPLPRSGRGGIEPKAPRSLRLNSVHPIPPPIGSWENGEPHNGLRRRRKRVSGSPCRRPVMSGQDGPRHSASCFPLASATTLRRLGATAGRRA